MRALITGGTGFVGRHLSRHLEALGERVFCLTSNPAEESNDVSDFRLLDIRDEERLSSLFDEIVPEQVYHLAAVSSISGVASDERTAFDVNVWGTRNVLRSTLKSGSTRVLNISTSQVYGDHAASPIAEDCAVGPRNSYAATKAMAEVLCSQYADRCGIVIARPFNHSGPGQAPDFVLSYLAHQIALIETEKIEPVIRTGDLGVRRDFTDVRDVVKAYVLLMDKGVSGEVYNICSGQAYLLSDALDFMLSLTDVRIQVERDQSRARMGQAATIYGTSEKLECQTGWRPTIGFEQMLTDILQYWRTVLSPSASELKVSN